MKGNQWVIIIGVSLLPTVKKGIVCPGKIRYNSTQKNSSRLFCINQMYSGLSRRYMESRRYGKDQPGGYAGTDKENDLEAELF